MVDPGYGTEAIHNDDWSAARSERSSRQPATSSGGWELAQVAYAIVPDRSYNARNDISRAFKYPGVKQIGQYLIEEGDSGGIDQTL